MSLFLHTGKKSLPGIWDCKGQVLAVGEESRGHSALLVSLTFPMEHVGYVLWAWPAKLSTPLHTNFFIVLADSDLNTLWEKQDTLLAAIFGVLSNWTLQFCVHAFNCWGTHGREGSFLSSASLVFSSVLIDFCKWLLQSVWYTKGVANRTLTDDLEKGEFCPAFQQNVDMLTLSLVYYLTWKFFTENLPWFAKEAYWQLLIWEPGTILGGKILCRACFQLCVNEVMYGM